MYVSRDLTIIIMFLILFLIVSIDLLNGFQSDSYSPSLP